MVPRLIQSLRSAVWPTTSCGKRPVRLSTGLFSHYERKWDTPILIGVKNPRSWRGSLMCIPFVALLLRRHAAPQPIEHMRRGKYVRIGKTALDHGEVAFEIVAAHIAARY